MCLGGTVSAEENVAIDEINFPDEGFRTYVSENIDANEDQLLQVEEIANATYIDFDYGTYWVMDLTGLEYFTELEYFNCAFNGVSVVDVSKNTKLQILDCSYNEDLTTIDISTNTNLQELHCFETPLASLDVTKNTELVRLDCNNTKVAEIDVTKNTKLTLLNVTNTNIKEMENFDASHFTCLEELYCNNAGIQSLNLKTNSNLYSLDCGNNKLTSLDLSGIGYLWYIAEVSPQNDEITTLVSNDSMMLDMKTVVEDISKLIVADNEGYTYDEETGVITFNNIEEMEIAFTYDHGYPYGLDLIQVTVNVIPEYQNNDQHQPGDSTKPEDKDDTKEAILQD